LAEVCNHALPSLFSPYFIIGISYLQTRKQDQILLFGFFLFIGDIQQAKFNTQYLFKTMALFDKFKEKVNSAKDKMSDKMAETREKVGTAVSNTKEKLKFTRLREGLTKTRTNLVNRLAGALLPGRKIDEALIQEIEEILITADIGVKTTTALIASVRNRVRKEGLDNAAELYDFIKQEILAILQQGRDSIKSLDDAKPTVIMVVGVNGVGKTTSIGKLALNFKESGKSVIIGAADTFRAAASEQLEVWAERADVPIIKQQQGADPAAVAFDTLQAAIARESDIVMIDTAGRLHNKTGLMAELEKISRVMKKLRPTAPEEVFLVLDATTGQNAIQQAKEFTKVAPVTGLILTKLDGTAKGGVVIAIANEFKIPVRYIGVGEKIADLQEFDPAEFVNALFETEEHGEESANT
jgi:fused signal recognition particle receptor